MEIRTTRVLIIDDDERDVRLVRELLAESESGKYFVESSEQLSEGLLLMVEGEFDVILLDLNLPDSHGEETYNDVIQKGWEIPVIVLTGLDDQEMGINAVQAGAQDYLVKGEFNGKSLARSIDYAFERYQLKKKIFDISIRDSLTGVYNRKGFVTLAEQQLKLAQRTREDLSFLFVDLDGLKEINDRFGHQAGDRALIATADVLSTTFRDSDIVGRAGGDEFVVLALGSQSPDHASILQRLGKSRDEFQKSSDDEFSLSFSVGVSTWSHEEPKSLDALMREADAAMYKHKRTRRLNQHPDEILPQELVFLEFGTQTPQPQGSLAEISVMLVEDNLGDARLIQEYLKDTQFGCDVLHVEHLEGALDLLVENRPSLVLLDLSLPDSHGIETVERLVSTNPDVPVIVMTGLDDPDMAGKALQLGAQDYLVKGKFDENLLGRTIQYAFERHHLRLQNLRYASELHRNEARLTSIFNSVDVGIYRTTPDGRIRFANRALIEMMGFDSFEQLTERNLENAGFIDQGYREDFKRQMEEKGQIVGMESIWEKADGSLIFVRESSKSIRTPDGEILYYEGTAVNITAQVEAEKQLRLQSAALDAAANAIAIIDRSGDIMWVNPAFEDLTGYSDSEVLGQNPRVLKSGVHGEEFYASLWDTVLAGNVWQGEMINKRKDGSFYSEQQTIAPLVDSNGVVTHFIGVKQDVSARKMSEKVLQRHIEELTLLNAISSAGVSEVREDDLIEAVTEILSRSFFPDHFGVMLLDPSNELLLMHPSYRGLPEDLPRVEIPLSVGVIGAVARMGKPWRIPDVSKVPEYVATLQIDGHRSELCVPLIVGERILGVINAESHLIDAFSEDDERLLTTVAGQLATAIERIRQQQAEREQRIRAETLSDTALALNSSLAFDQILDQILINIERVVPYEAASLMLNENGYTRVIRHRNNGGMQPPGEAVGVKFSLDGDGKFQRMMETVQPIVIPDVEQSEMWMDMPQTQWVQSYLGVPIRKDVQTFGFLNLDHSQVGYFNSHHAEALRSLADQLAIAMENSRLYSEAQTRATELARLYDASGALLASNPSDISALGQTIVDTLHTDFGKSNCSLFLVDDVSGKLTRVAAAGKYSAEVFGGRTLFVDGPGIAPYAVRKAEIVNVSDVTRWPNYVANWQDARSEIAVPLILGGEVIGVIDIQSSQDHAFSENDQRIIAVFAERAALALQSGRLYDSQQRQLAFLESLHQIDLAITGSMNLQVTMDVVAKQVVGQLGVVAASILILNPFTLSLEPVACNGFSSGEIKTRFLNVGEGLGGLVVQEGVSIHRTCLEEDCPNCSRGDLFSKEGLVSYYGVPLIAKGQIKGVLEMYHREEFNPDSEWENFASTIATQAAIAIDNASMFEDLEKSNLELSLAYDTTLEGWAKALELRDRETEGHARRVVEMTLKLGRILGIGGIDLVHLRRGALLHDVGKMGVPDAILQKTGSLTEEEWEIMRQHPVYAFEWLSSINYLRPALDIPHYHHEKWDGTGYPLGLVAEQIPLPARIFAIVDVWDALRSDRPYRKAWSKDKTLDFIREQSGVHFDPRVVDAFLRLLEVQE